MHAAPCPRPPAGRPSAWFVPCALWALALGCAGSLPPPGSPSLTTPSAPPFVNGGTGANATSGCGVQAVAVGLVVGWSNVVDSVRLLCEPLTDVIAASPAPGTPAADPVEVTQPEGDATTTTVAAPPGYALAGVDVQDCLENDRLVIGRIRPVFKGVEAYGLHQTTIPGPWRGRLCHDPLFDDVHRFVGAHDGLGQAVRSVSCTATFGLDFALVRLDGQAAARLTDLSGLCEQVTPAKVNPTTRPRIPSWSWSAAAVQTVVLLAPARTTNVAKMTAPAGTLVTGFERLVASGSGYSHDTIYPFDALGVNGWGSDLSELVAGPQFGHAGPILSQGAPAVDGAAWDTPCDRGYVLVGLFGITSDTRMPNLNGTCVPFDIENQARGGQVLLPSLSTDAADLYSTGINGSLPSGESFFPAQGHPSSCGVDRNGKLQQVRGFTWEWSDDHHARVVTSLLCDTVVAIP